MNDPRPGVSGARFRHPLLGRLRPDRGRPSSNLALPESAFSAAQSQDGTARPNGQVAEITDLLDLSGWPCGSRVIVRRERPHPGAQLSFTDHDGHRFQAILTDQAGEIAHVERRPRARARVGDQIRDDKDTGLSKLPFRSFAMNAVWLELVLIAHDLIAWTKTLLLSGELARAEPKRLRHRLFHVAARLAFSGRRAYRPAGPGHASSPPPSSDSKHYPHRPANPTADPRQLDRPAGATRPTKPARDRPTPSASTPPRPQRRSST